MSDLRLRSLPIAIIRAACAIGWLWLLVLSAVFAPPALAEGFPPAAHHMKVELVAETDHPASGKPLSLAIVMTPQPGWHGYWINPGEAGFAPDFKWTLPEGVTVSEPRYPVPEKLVVSGLVNHVFSGLHALLVTMNVPNAAAGTALPAHLRINYLVCSDQVCVPESAELDAKLAVGDGAVLAPLNAKFDQWRSALPQTLPQSIPNEGSRVDNDPLLPHFEYNSSSPQLERGNTVRISIPYPSTSPSPSNPWLYSKEEGVIQSAGIQRFTRVGNALVVEARAGNKGDLHFVESCHGKDFPNCDLPYFARSDLLLALGNGHGIEFQPLPGHVPTGGTPIAIKSESPAPASLLAVLTALGGALLGGLILNLMPCVFPVIGLKAISLARGGGDEREVRRDVLAYAAGVILTVLALGGLMLGLRAAGHAVGWAFQLQDPKVILLLLVLVTAITANLAGLFELRSVSAGDGLTRQKGLAGSFWTGALAAFVATPCTGPFMAAALGAALVLPTYAALMIFAGLGLGMALPFLALGFIPALRTRLPKPGPWMRRFQQIMAVPMALTALGLLWLLWRQTGGNGLLIGLVVGALCLLALWLIGRNQRDGAAVGVRNWLQLLIPAAVGVALLTQLAPPVQAPATEAGLLNAEPFSEVRLAALQAAHRPVFAYFTADWCLTCKVNEKAAIETQAVADAFKAKHVAVLVGDWTNGDAALTRFLEAHGRSGVPLYLYYPADGGAPKELPQVLTPGLLAGL